MKFLLKVAALAAGVAVAPIFMAQAAAPAAAPAAEAPAASIAVLDIDGAVLQSAAYKAAVGQIQTSYKTQIAAVQARQAALQAELKPLATEIEGLQRTPTTPRATLEAKAGAYQQKVQGAQAELQRMAAPYERAAAFAREQVGDKLEPAVKGAMTARKVNIVLKPEAISAVQGGFDLTPDVITQLNALVPSVSIAPPANWQPGQPRADAAAPAGR
jgi:Skp family chaperone for outer membrane proteins